MPQIANDGVLVKEIATEIALGNHRIANFGQIQGQRKRCMADRLRQPADVDACHVRSIARSVEVKHGMHQIAPAMLELCLLNQLCVRIIGILVTL